jgi:large subunit ribosomal protein L22
MAVETKEYRAEAKFQRVSPQKARLVLDLIKGRGVEEALAVAAFTKKRIAPVIHKLLTSAVDNAKYVDNLYVKLALANDGPRMKRIRPAPMGRAFRYQRRLTHIVLSVAEREGTAGLVTKVEEPKLAPKAAIKTTGEAKPASTKTARATKKKAEKPKAAAKKAAAAKKKAEEPKAAAKTAGATKKKAEEPKAAAKKASATKKKAGK